MPCRDYNDPPNDRDRPSNERPNLILKDNPSLKDRNDFLARVACDALTQIENSKSKVFISALLTNETREWWEEHKKQDAKHNTSNSEEPHG